MTTKQRLALLLAGLIATATFGLVASAPAQAAPASKTVSVAVAMIKPMSAADGCSTFASGSDGAPSTAARCTGGYVGYIGSFRAHQKCHFLFVTQDQYGAWVQIGRGLTSYTSPCVGLWSDSAGYQLRGP